MNRCAAYDIGPTFVFVVVVNKKKTSFCVGGPYL